MLSYGSEQFSDERIKIVEGVSDPVADLDVLNKIQITDYRYRNPAMNHGPVKKVIGQQVHSVYPQAVSLSCRVLDETPQPIDIKQGTFSLPEHTLSVGDVVRLRLSDGEEQEASVAGVDAGEISLDKSIDGEAVLMG
ncbi:MAG: tail fiber domain-containing protein [Hahellaceae bacterium]|nr:tail fiber domain-containing protein [Hahellaceae bacterium]